jgi:hypothetical protein
MGRVLLTPVPDAEPCIAFRRDQAEREQIVDAKTRLTPRRQAEGAQWERARVRRVAVRGFERPLSSAGRSRMAAIAPTM